HGRCLASRRLRCRPRQWLGCPALAQPGRVPAAEQRRRPARRAPSVESRTDSVANPAAGAGRHGDDVAMVTPIRVLICDDHTLVRSGLRKLLECEPELTVVGEAGTAEEAIQAAREKQPDVLLLDVVMPGRSGIEALPDLTKAAPATRVLILSM